MASTPQMSQVLPSTTKPAELEYGGDEISALVLDPGTNTTRCGFAGEDTPKTCVPTSYGIIPDPEETKFLGKLKIGDNAIHSVIDGMEIRNPMHEGIVENWDVTTEIWRHCIEYRLSSRVEEHPLLVTEPIWNPLKKREKTTEIVFEDFNVPAYFLVKSAVCESFANTKGTALVVNVGHTYTSVTPVIDGIPLKKGSERTPLAGQHLTTQLRHQFSDLGIRMAPWLMIKTKAPYTDLTNPTPLRTRDYGFQPHQSFLELQQDRFIHEFKECISETWPKPKTFPTDINSVPESNRLLQDKAYEFPDGYQRRFGLDRCLAPESLFNPSVSPKPFTGETPKGIAEMIKDSIDHIDADARVTMLNNIVVVGGTSLLYRFNERLNEELMAMFPGPRVKIYSPGQIPERKYSAWLGGSILASLGAFHQLWISKQEYDEIGANIIERRAK
ncbi:NuA4 histone acetyltransferase subunit [Orbilia ellipsospora]|uniref:NuA4 histone acetyltransferase subunit n=1 Tax=Orbilia ellipsospora TaxID=2528407 RepID=A0AAV9XCV7_9PEZI